MTISIKQVSGDAAIALISPEIVGIVSTNDYVALYQFLHHSTAVWVGKDNDKVVGFWGLIVPTLISDRAYLWLHTTSAVTEYKFVFVRHSQIIIKEMLKMYPRITGHCIVGETKSIRWLKWLGAEFKSPKGKLIPFEIRTV